MISYEQQMDIYLKNLKNSEITRRDISPEELESIVGKEGSEELKKKGIIIEIKPDSKYIIRPTKYGNELLI